VKKKTKIEKLGTWETFNNKKKQMSFNYKNPVSDSIIFTPYSVYRESDTGTIFSVNSVGGYMEVFYLSDLDWTIQVGRAVSKD
jgi:hypothetical protein